MIRITTKQYNANTIERAQAAFNEHAVNVCRSRILLISLGVTITFAILILRLFLLPFMAEESFSVQAKTKQIFKLKRANIVDRNGEVLATNISTASLYADPRDIREPKEIAKKLAQGLDINLEDLQLKLTSDKSFVWVKRHITPKEQQIVHDLAIPGIYFARDERRIFPQSNLFSHIVGFVNIDGKGLAGVERYYDEELTNNLNQDITLSLDSRIQSIVKDELEKSIEMHHALGGSGLVMDIKTGEMIAMVSLPDFNPHNIDAVTDRQLFNQLTLGNYEFGSGAKLITLSMALDMGKVTVNDAFNVSQPISVGRFKINDYKGKGGNLSVPEILMYSSNIGTAKIAATCGIKAQQEYLKRFGMLDPIELELSEISRPLYPNVKRWNEASMITISFGHGIAMTAVNLAQAIASIANDGKKVSPTIMKLEDKNQLLNSEQIISKETSETMKKILRLIVTDGYGKKANIPGYFVGGKSGTAEKVIGRKYSKTANLASFVSVYPMHEPRYVIFAMIDEAKGNKFNMGYTTGGMIAAPIVGEIVKRISPLLNVYPETADSELINAKLNLQFRPRYQKVSN